MRSWNELANAGPRGVTDLTDGEIKTIAAFVVMNEQKNPDATYLEIGVLAGSTIMFCKQYTKTTQFFGVDLFEDYRPDPNNTHISDTFRMEDVARRVGNRATFMKGNSYDILPTINNTFDFVFIDGNHTYLATKQDFCQAAPLVKKGGYVAFHNASAHLGPDFEQYVIRDGGPLKICQEILMLDMDWKLVESVDRLRVFKKMY